MRDFGVLLTNFALFDQLCCVSKHCGPIVPLPQDFSRQCPSYDVISIYAFMYFPQHVVGVFPCNALKDGCEKTSLIKGSPVIVNLEDLDLSLDASFGSFGSSPSIK